MPEYSDAELLSSIPTWKTVKEIHKELERLKQARISIGVLYNRLDRLVIAELAISRKRTVSNQKKVWEFQACRQGGVRKRSFVVAHLAA